MIWIIVAVVIIVAQSYKIAAQRKDILWLQKALKDVTKQLGEMETNYRKLLNKHRR